VSPLAAGAQDAVPPSAAEAPAPVSAGEATQSQSNAAGRVAEQAGGANNHSDDVSKKGDDSYFKSLPQPIAYALILALTQYTTAMFEKIFGAADQLYETFLAPHEATLGHLSEKHRYDAYLYTGASGDHLRLVVDQKRQPTSQAS
jgi:hypothetical protein